MNVLFFSFVMDGMMSFALDSSKDGLISFYFSRDGMIFFAFNWPKAALTSFWEADWLEFFFNPEYKQGWIEWDSSFLNITTLTSPATKVNGPLMRSFGFLMLSPIIDLNFLNSSKAESTSSRVKGSYLTKILVKHP